MNTRTGFRLAETCRHPVERNGSGGDLIQGLAGILFKV